MVRTWWALGQSSFPGRGALPGRTAMGGRIDVMSGFSNPNAFRRARKNSLYVDSAGNIYINSDGAFTWCLWPSPCGV